ncbi:hypothetical protein BH23ACT9_BH23ACT9_31820 [soil metagenome]
MGTMDDFVPPAYGIPAGPRLDAAPLVAAFASGQDDGHCDTLRVEGDLLVTGTGGVAAIRLAAGAVLVRGRGALVDPAADVRPQLLDAGLRAFQDDPPLADVVALMSCGLRGTPWDLWGRDAQQAVGALERAATGDVGVDLGATADRLHTDLGIADYEDPAWGWGQA